MNINLSKTETTPQDTDPVDRSDPKKAEAEANLSRADAALLQTLLGTGLTGYARQGDVVELHKRIGEKFEKLPTELSALTAEQSKDLVARMDALETSLNGLEAAMRIELPPLLTRTVSDAVQEAAPSKKSGLAGLFWLLIFGLGGVALGAWFHAPLLDLARQAPAYFSF